MKTSIFRALQAYGASTHKPEVEGSSPSLDTTFSTSEKITKSPLIRCFKDIKWFVFLTLQFIVDLQKNHNLRHTMAQCDVITLKATQW
jgi:hypothetical protein